MIDHYVLVNVTVTESKGKEALENPGGEALMVELGGAKACRSRRSSTLMAWVELEKNVRVGQRPGRRPKTSGPDRS